MISDSQSRGLAPTKRVFTRPADLHLAWSTSKGVASPFSHTTSLTSAESGNVPVSSSTSASTQLRPVYLSSISRPLPSHPYSSFAPHSDEVWSGEAMERRSSSALEQDISATTKTSWIYSGAESSSSILKSGQLVWKNVRETGSRKGTLGGFEKALRRRQAAKEHASERDRLMFVTLEQIKTGESSERFKTACFDAPCQQRRFGSEPFLASPGACDPSAFDNDGMLSLVSPPVPISLSDQNRWVPPPSWDVFKISSEDQDSQSRSSGSSVSDPLQTPRSSQPGSPRECETYLSIHAHDGTRRGHSSRSSGAPKLKLRITRDSTVEVQNSPLDGRTPDHPAHLRHKQLVVTGEPSSSDQAKHLQLRASPYGRSEGSQTSVCVLSSPNMAELNEWLYSIEDAIQSCTRSNQDRFGTRRSSGSMLDTIRLLEQLKVQRDDAWHSEKDQQATPVAAPRSLPSASLLPPATGGGSEDYIGSGSEFSPSAFIDYYTANPDSAAIAAESSASFASEALYDFEDAYSSIMKRFSDYELGSPMHSLPSAPLGGVVRHVRSDCLDVPVSPCSIEFEHDFWTEQDEAPSSPLDPWLVQRCSRSASSLSSRDTEPYADDAVRQIFAEGFRRRSSTLSCLPADS